MPWSRRKEHAFMLFQDVCFGPKTTEERGKVWGYPTSSRTECLRRHQDTAAGSGGSREVRRPCGAVSLGPSEWQGCHDLPVPMESREERREQQERPVPTIPHKRPEVPPATGRKGQRAR